MELASREPIIFNLTPRVPIGATLQAYWADKPGQHVALRNGDPGQADDQIALTPYFRLNLEEGWQWRSNPVGVLWDDDLERGFGPDLIEARTQDELLYNDPEWGYFGTMISGAGIDDNVAYKVRMAADYRSRTFGQSLSSSPFELAVSEGWTWLPTPYFYDRRLEGIFSADDLREGMVVVAKEDGSAEWDGTEWQGDLEVLPAEQSFLLYVPDGAATTLHYRYEQLMPQGNEAATARRQRTERQTVGHDVARRFRDNTSLVADLPQLPATSDYQLLAYVGGELRGAGTYTGGHHFLTIHADGGERVSLRLTDVRHGVSYAIDESLTVGGPRFGSLREPLQLHSQEAVQGIASVHSSEFIVHSYDLQGRRADTGARPGLRIVRYADGTVRKLINQQ